MRKNNNSLWLVHNLFIVKDGDPSALILPTPDGPDPASDLASYVPTLILPSPDGPDLPSDVASSVPAHSLPTPDGPAFSEPAADDFSPSSGDNFLPPLVG